jgi:hypothetical protein
MKKRDWVKALVLVLIVAFIIPCFTSCSAATKVLTLKADNGKTYTINKEQLEFLMCYTKANVFMENGWPSAYDLPDVIWNREVDSETKLTADDNYKQLVVNQLKGVLVEQYLFDKYNLSLNAEEVASQKKTIDQNVKDMGGTGSYKQYWGYRWQMLYEHTLATMRSSAIQEYLYGENGTEKVTDEELDKYYQDNYSGYYMIMLYMTHKIVVEDEGNRVRTTTKDSQGNEVENDEYKMEELTDDEKEEKALLPQILIYKLEDDADFEEIAKEYSDSYLSVKYPNGLFVLTGSSLVNDSAVSSALKELEIGEYTQPISVSDGKYTYIIKRIPLRDKIYEDEEYEDLFSSYAESVKYEKYDSFLKNYATLIEVNDSVISKMSMAKTFLTEYVDYYYRYLRQVS